MSRWYYARTYNAVRDIFVLYDYRFVYDFRRRARARIIINANAEFREYPVAIISASRPLLGRYDGCGGSWLGGHGTVRAVSLTLFVSRINTSRETFLRRIETKNCLLPYQKSPPTTDGILVRFERPTILS